MKHFSLTLCALFAPTLVLASSPTRQEVLAAQKKVLAAEQAERQLLGTLYSINQRMKDMSKRRDRLTDRRFVTESDVRQLAAHSARLEGGLKFQREGLRRRVRGLYLLNGQTAMRSVFSSESSVEFDRNLRFLKKITDRDYGLIKNYQKTLTALQKKRQQLDRRVRSLARIQSALKRQEQQLQADQAAKGELLTRLKDSQSRHLNELKDLRKSQANEGLSDLDTAFYERKGQLRKPVEGELVKGYGIVQDEDYRFKLGHKGWFIRAAKSEPVRGVFRGRVAFAGEVPGYGKAAIVDHGDHYYTFYSHLTGLYVRVDDRIEEGQTIGLAGGSSPWFGPGTYFEIRHFSDAIDPQPWFQSM